MLTKSLFAGAALGLSLSSAVAHEAPVVEGNEPQTVYEAVLQDKDNTTVRGTFTTHGAEDGIGIQFHYHIHDNPVPKDGNCYATGGHLDPYKRGDQPPCNTTVPQTCQVGDISGKHGPVWTADGNFEVLYRDFFLSNVEDTIAFFGNRSVVVHLPDNKRINCGNFHLVSDGEEKKKKEEAKEDQGC
ncbi:unnamed protein product [Aspergillus oryzae]|nr:unnamed protein product [Aspergillus oryzae]GMF93268.1 unnamed protein product [Aspergillus oryzae]GMG05658.1 unnamed protein product [Aspergillus oryzae]